MKKKYDIEEDAQMKIGANQRRATLELFRTLNFVSSFFRYRTCDTLAK